MKKYLPVVILVLGILLVGSVFVVNKMRNSGEEVMEEENIPELPAEQRPFVSLTPTEDGHRLSLSIENINVQNADTLDFILLYTRGDGVEQGTSGYVANLESGQDVSELLLLGSESSGKFRYDEGVEFGTLTLKFRDKEGKSIGKTETQFHLQQNSDSLTSADGNFTHELDNPPEDVFFVTMNTFQEKEGVTIEGTYAIFSSDGESY